MSQALSASKAIHTTSNSCIPRNLEATALWVPVKLNCIINSSPIVDIRKEIDRMQIADPENRNSYDKAAIAGQMLFGNHLQKRRGAQ